jgi:hypothetical protein
MQWFEIINDVECPSEDALTPDEAYEAEVVCLCAFNRFSEDNLKLHVWDSFQLDMEEWSCNILQAA